MRDVEGSLKGIPCKVSKDRIPSHNAADSGGLPQRDDALWQLSLSLSLSPSLPRFLSRLESVLTSNWAVG